MPGLVFPEIFLESCAFGNLDGLAQHLPDIFAHIARKRCLVVQKIASLLPCCRVVAFIGKSQEGMLPEIFQQWAHGYIGRNGSQFGQTKRVRPVRKRSRPLAAGICSPLMMAAAACATAWGVKLFLQTFWSGRISSSPRSLRYNAKPIARGVQALFHWHALAPWKDSASGSASRRQGALGPYPA